MNIVPTLDAAIALSGYGAGLVVGCLNNIRKTGSLFEIPIDKPKNVSFIVKHLEVNRDSSGVQNMTNPSEFLIPKIWNPFMPLEHLMPLTVLTITQVFIAVLTPGATVTTGAILISTYTFKVLVLPIVLNAAVLAAGMVIRQLFDSCLLKVGIDASGHALAQSSSAVYKLLVFSSLASLNISSNSYRAVAAVTTLSDYLWTHRTVSSYHRVMDMVCTTIFMGISFGTVYAGHRALVAYGPGVLQMLTASLSRV